MNLIFSGLILILSLIFIKKIITKTSGKTVADERTELVKLKASRAAFVTFTITIAISSFLLIFLSHNGHVTSNFIYHIGVITSYLASLLLILFIIFYAYFNNNS
ncbi:DUF2178 domain-containing protein [Patescibacteria group bacterium]